ncbi:MAG TPA: SUMF1/EgtB/PvdO family nonheme iron enzyme [Polyangiaceae bacterium]|nr:SUMF1/EgtB/PvdO family nonheme iron enzyme [Polyangiaceae bacterium]
MLEVSGGDFFMGSDAADEQKAGADSSPAHPVRLGRYCLDEFEVTAAEFKACSDAGKCKRATPTNRWDGITAKQQKLYDPICNANDYAGRAAHPMNCVDWQEAQNFCVEMRGGRLPTEAEWEFAARGSDGRIYPWGDDPPEPGLLNACGAECTAWGRKNPDYPNVLAPMYKSDDGFAHTSPVGSFPRGKTSHGMKDMVGNVGEWVGDFFANYTNGPRVTDPKGPEKGASRVVRGGGWNAGNPMWLRPTYRFAAEPVDRSHGVGFRCARAL